VGCLLRTQALLCCGCLLMTQALLCCGCLLMTQALLCCGLPSHDTNTAASQLQSASSWYIKGKGRDPHLKRASYLKYVPSPPNCLWYSPTVWPQGQLVGSFYIGEWGLHLGFTSLAMDWTDMHNTAILCMYSIGKWEGVPSNLQKVLMYTIQSFAFKSHRQMYKHMVGTQLHPKFIFFCKWS
jgi:hypothetical protein